MQKSRKQTCIRANFGLLRLLEFNILIALGFREWSKFVSLVLHLEPSVEIYFSVHCSFYQTLEKMIEIHLMVIWKLRILLGLKVLSSSALRFSINISLCYDDTSSITANDIIRSAYICMCTWTCKLGTTIPHAHHDLALQSSESNETRDAVRGKAGLHVPLKSGDHFPSVTPPVLCYSKAGWSSEIR